MDQETKERFLEHKEFITTRASKEEVNFLRKLLVLLLVAFLGAGGFSVWANTGTNERISVLETQIASFTHRQQENNELLREIERLLRESRNQ